MKPWSLRHVSVRMFSLSCRMMAGAKKVVTGFGRCDWIDGAWELCARRAVDAADGGVGT